MLTTPQILRQADELIRESDEFLRSCRQHTIEAQAQVDATRKTIEDSLTKLRTPDNLLVQNSKLLKK
jgi:hypothetical protein